MQAQAIQAISIQNVPNGYQVFFDSRYFDRAWLSNFLERAEIEYLAKKLDLDESILELGEEIKAKWWRENKHRWIKDEPA